MGALGQGEDRLGGGGFRDQGELDVEAWSPEANRPKLGEKR